MKNALILLLCLGLCGCATFSSQMNSLKIGMTKDDVIKIMGQPVSTSSKGNVEFMNYALTETSTQWWYGWTSPYSVCLQNGKVISFGRTGDFGTTAQPKEVIELDQKVTTSNNGDNADLESRLKTLNKLLADGVITQDDFNQQKAKLLNEYTSK